MSLVTDSVDRIPRCLWKRRWKTSFVVDFIAFIVIVVLFVVVVVVVVVELVSIAIKTVIVAILGNLE